MESLEDVRAGTGRWRNIQDTVRLTIAELCGTVQAQALTIRALEAKVDSLCGHLATTSARAEEIASQCASRIQGLERMLVSVTESRSGMIAPLETRVSSLEDTSSRLISMVRTFESQVPAISDLRAFATKAELAEKASIADVTEALALKANKESVEKALKGKADIDRRPSLTSIVSRHDWEKISAELESLNASTRQSFSELTAAVGRKATKIEANEVRTEIEKTVRQFHSELTESLSKKVSRSELSKALSTKADVYTSDTRVLAAHEEMLRLYKQKADASDLSQLKKKADASTVQEILRTQAEMQRQLLLKADTSDISALLAANSDIRHQLDRKADATELRALAATQADLISSTRTASAAAAKAPDESKETPQRGKRAVTHPPNVSSISPERVLSPPVSQGRWIWKSKELLDGKVVPWEVQAVNDSPDSLQWRPGRGSIITMKPGLYQVALGFFSPSPPKVTVFVDDAAAISTPPSPTAGPEAPIIIHRHPAGCVGGLSLLQFLALPARANVSVTFEAESSGQGFMWITKL